jgi:hypothetical protein
MWKSGTQQQVLSKALYTFDGRSNSALVPSTRVSDTQRYMTLIQMSTQLLAIMVPYLGIAHD